MHLDTLRAELEGLFDLDGLHKLGRDVLGLEPQDVGGDSSKSSFVKSLTDRCVAESAVEALCDAMAATGEDIDSAIAEVRTRGFVEPDELHGGAAVGACLITDTIGDGPRGTVYRATWDGRPVRLKVLRREATHDRRALRRFLAATRMLGDLDHSSIPSRVFAGQFENRFAVVHDHVDGEPLSKLLADRPPFQFEEAWPLLRRILEGLAALHERHMAHGALHPDNVLVVLDEWHEQNVRLLDIGSAYLRLTSPETAFQPDRLSLPTSPRTVAPEQLRGQVADARADVYAFGALMYEMLSGRLPFPAPTALEAVAGHLALDPKPLSAVAHHDWFVTRLDEVMLRLLDKDPDRRFSDASFVLRELETIARSSVAGLQLIDEDEIQDRIRVLLDNPLDDDAAVSLEAAVAQGAEPQRIAEAFRWVAEQLGTPQTRTEARAQRSLLAHAARLYEGPAKELTWAESIHEHLLELDPDDEAARAGLMRVRRRLGKHEELVEMLLEQSQSAQTAAERGRAFSEIGTIYANDLDDPEQALVAFTQAFCEDPQERSHAAQVERVAGNSIDAWSEALSSCMATVESDVPVDVKNRIYVQMARWYSDKIARPDLSLPCYQAVLAVEPGNTAALTGLAAVYRRAQQWRELGMVLMAHADAAVTPAQARDLRTEAADLLFYKLSEPEQARLLYEQILSEDPANAPANRALAKIYEAAGDLGGYVRTLEQQCEVLVGEDRHELLCRIGELYENQLDDVPQALSRYESVLAEDPSHLDALRGQDRCFARTGQYAQQLTNLEQQLQLAATPRQKIGLYERIAGIYDEEFLDHAKAAEACEAILDIESTHDGALTQLARHFRALERWADLTVVYERQLDVVTDDSRRVDIGLALGKVLAEKLQVPERAIDTYELVLAIDSETREALDALAELRAAEGDAERALDAIEALAEKAATPEARAMQYVRAGELLEARKDLDGAIERYKLAMDAFPENRRLWDTLRDAYRRKGDHAAAADLLEREIEETEGERAKARLCGKLARVLYDGLHDDLRAEALAKRALGYDPTTLDATIVLGDVAYSNGQFVTAVKHYEQVVKHSDAVEPEEALRLQVAYMESLVQSGDPQKGLEIGLLILERAPEDRDVLMRVAELSFEHGSDERTYELYRTLLTKWGDELEGDPLVLARYRLGETARRAGDVPTALEQLQIAVDLEPGSVKALQSLAKVHQSREDWGEAVRVMYELIDCLEGDERVELLIEIGDLAASKLQNSDYAAESYLWALSDRPDDRKILMKLMQLYSEEKDWGKLVDIILRLADLVDDDKQKAKYLLTAGKVCSRELGDIGRGADLLSQAAALDPTQDRALDEALGLRRQLNDWEAVKDLLKVRIKGASMSNDRGRMLESMDELARVYDGSFGRLDQAVAVLEEMLALDRENVERKEALTGLYLRDVGTYFEKAVALQTDVLARDPYRADAYRALRSIYTKRKLPDATWCACQALYSINQAAPDETMFYKRLRSDSAAVVQGRLTADEWQPLLMHPVAAPLLTELFALIQPAIATVRAERLEALGYTAEHQIFPEHDPYMMGQILHYVAEALGIDPPPLYQNTNDPGGVSFLHAQTPSLVLGRLALAVESHSQDAAFVAGSQITYFRPGLYVRHLVPTGTGLKAWLFAAIKLSTPAFPVAADLEGEIRPALGALEAQVTKSRRDHLSSIVAKLMQQGEALDLKKWVAGVDLTADRVGLVTCHDLQTALSQIRASGDNATSVPAAERMKELLRFSVSANYIEIRRRLGITVDM